MKLTFLLQASVYALTAMAALTVHDASASSPFDAANDPTNAGHPSVPHVSAPSFENPLDAATNATHAGAPPVSAPNLPNPSDAAANAAHVGAGTPPVAAPNLPNPSDAAANAAHTGTGTPPVAAPNLPNPADAATHPSATPTVIPDVTAYVTSLNPPVSDPSLLTDKIAGLVPVAQYLMSPQVPGGTALFASPSLPVLNATQYIQTLKTPWGGNDFTPSVSFIQAALALTQPQTPGGTALLPDPTYAQIAAAELLTNLQAAAPSVAAPAPTTPSQNLSADQVKAVASTDDAEKPSRDPELNKKVKSSIINYGQLNNGQIPFAVARVNDPTADTVMFTNMWNHDNSAAYPAGVHIDGNSFAMRSSDLKQYFPLFDPSVLVAYGNLADAKNFRVTFVNGVQDITQVLGK